MKRILRIEFQYNYFRRDLIAKSRTVSCTSSILLACFFNSRNMSISDMSVFMTKVPTASERLRKICNLISSVWFMFWKIGKDQFSQISVRALTRLIFIFRRHCSPSELYFIFFCMWESNDSHSSLF